MLLVAQVNICSLEEEGIKAEGNGESVFFCVVSWRCLKKKMNVGCCCRRVAGERSGPLCALSRRK
jgi:hypothetical protein